MDFDLLDLVPEKSVVNLNGKPYVLRPVTLSDEAWIGRTFGDGVEKVFSELHMESICKIIFHQLEDKADFLPLDEDGYDDDGEPTKLRVPGYERVMRGITGKRAQIEALQALLKTIGWSKPLLDEDEQKELATNKDKKKQSKRKPKQTGQQSLTP